MKYDKAYLITGMVAVIFTIILMIEIVFGPIFL